MTFDRLYILFQQALFPGLQTCRTCRNGGVQFNIEGASIALHLQASFYKADTADPTANTFVCLVSPLQLLRQRAIMMGDYPMEASALQHMPVSRFAGHRAV